MKENNVVFVGATKGMGRALARRMAERGDRLFLLGRDADALARSAADLTATGRATAGTAHLDLEDESTFDPALDAAESALGRIDIVVITAGAFGTQEQLEEDREHLRRVLHTDFTATILLCERARIRLLAPGGGTLVVFSSVAGDRGRKPVVLYGAAKAGLSHYLEGLDHRYHGQGLRVVDVKPGFVKTSMTAGLKAPPFSGTTDDVAERVLAAIDAATPVVYAPAPWKLVMTVVRWLPRTVMRRVGF